MKSEKSIMTPSDDQRTTPTGLFHFAQSYHDAANSLLAANLQSTHPHAPIAFLLYHSIELFLKSFLRLRGLNVIDLKRVGHEIVDLAKASEAKGLGLDDEDREVLLAIRTDEIFRARYIKTGLFTRPTLEALERTCSSLRESVHQALALAGVHLRL